MPDFEIEKGIWRSGFRVVGGMDEVGRGSFAGPVVAGVVVFERSIKPPIKINDSKKLTAKQREEADRWIRDNALIVKLGQASVTQINKLGIKKATDVAFRRAVAGLKLDYLLIDAFYVPYVRGLKMESQKAIIKGDSLSYSIAAASIVAKVYRDNLMINLSQEYSHYFWQENKGYGTKFHREAIKKYGPSKFHRKDFIKNCVS